MHRLATWKIIALCAVLATGGSFAQLQDFEETESANVRVMRHEDGSRTIFKRSDDSRTLIKRTRNAGGKLILVTVYRMDAQGNETGCKIYDGDKKELFKVSYGYRKSDGQLVEERMFDSQVKRIDPVTKQEMPVRRVVYTYDAEGNRSAPISYTYIQGKTAEELFGAQPSALGSNPFAVPRDAKPVNPRATPVSR